MQQGHVLGAVERQALVAVVMHHLRDAGEHAAALVQGVAVLFGLGDDNVDAALARPGSHEGNDTGDENQPTSFTHGPGFSVHLAQNRNSGTCSQPLRQCFIMHLMH